MTLSIFDIFKIGIGPSSSHTVGPMRAARMFGQELLAAEQMSAVARVKAEMFGSLGATGRGHGTAKAVMLGLEAEQAETVDVANIACRVDGIRTSKSLSLAGTHPITFDEEQDLILNAQKTLAYHPNGMVFCAFDAEGRLLSSKTYYSIGGGFVVEEGAADASVAGSSTELPYPFRTAADLLAQCAAHGKSISEVMWANEGALRPEVETRAGIKRLWDAMQTCVDSGCRNQGILPGGLKVRRRAPALYQKLSAPQDPGGNDPLTMLDWVSLFALAVNEENAAGGRVVTAPTNGAAGIIPAVLHYYVRFVLGANDAGVERFLLTAAAIGILYKENGSISGAEVGCQGEVGSACSMAAGALVEVLGGTPQQVENAAEIGMEHNLGLTCDPIGGLVQIPCIERNAMAAAKAIHAAHLALLGDGTHFVSLDRVIRTMRDTGRDMHDKYKETARGGLAINGIEMPVNIVEC